MGNKEPFLNIFGYLEAFCIPFVEPKNLWNLRFSNLITLFLLSPLWLSPIFVDIDVF